MQIRNKKGEVPITILVIGVFAICGLAIFTFLMADFKLGNSFVGVSLMQKMDVSIDEYKFYVKAGVDPAVASGFFPTMEENGVKYLYHHKNKTSFMGFGDSGELAFSVRYPIR